ncbi:hypothetical protein D9M72_546240 [compost metagenome]
MGTQAAREQAIAIADMDQVAGAAAGGADGARHHAGPGIDILGGIADHGRLARGAARRMHTRHLLARHREHAEGIVVAQVLLGQEWKLRQV